MTYVFFPFLDPRKASVLPFSFKADGRAFTADISIKLLCSVFLSSIL